MCISSIPDCTGIDVDFLFKWTTEHLGTMAPPLLAGAAACLFVAIVIKSVRTWIKRMHINTKQGDET